MAGRDNNRLCYEWGQARHRRGRGLQTQEDRKTGSTVTERAVRDRLGSGLQGVRGLRAADEALLQTVREGRPVEGDTVRRIGTNRGGEAVQIGQNGGGHWEPSRHGQTDGQTPQNREWTNATDGEPRHPAHRRLTARKPDDPANPQTDNALREQVHKRTVSQCVMRTSGQADNAQMLANEQSGLGRQHNQEIKRTQIWCQTETEMV
ncbi:hypothetical protein FB451DRAFT_1193130 [Mycena latifolia]|nr:hypothetical protein FB451DRAFT_1193130 [Mycena latifolia]